MRKRDCGHILIEIDLKSNYINQQFNCINPPSISLTVIPSLVSSSSLLRVFYLLTRCSALSAGCISHLLAAVKMALASAGRWLIYSPVIHPV